MTESSLLFIGTIICLLLTALFVGAETALISCDKLLLNKKKKEGNKRALLALKLLENIDYLLSTTQFGSNLFIALATTLATLFVKKYFGDNEIYVFVVFAPLMLIFSDSLPKVIGRHRSEKMSLLSALPIYLFSQIFSPVLFLISLYTNRLSKFMGLGRIDTISRRKKTREELHALLSEADDESEIRLGHKRMIRKILEFSQQNVKKVMLPLVSVDAIDKNATIQEAISSFENLRHSRLPVFEERVDNIVGILYFPDVFQCQNPEVETVNKFMRTALFVPEVQQLETLTKEMQEIEMAVVVDEYGGAVGIVTKEDVLEEIVGDISDEWDENQLSIMEMSPDTYLVHVATSINELNEKLNIHAPKGDYETLSGFLLLQFNRIPAVGDELYYANFKVKVHRANEKSIETVIIQVHRPLEEANSEDKL